MHRFRPALVAAGKGWQDDGMGAAHPGPHADCTRRTVLVGGAAAALAGCGARHDPARVTMWAMSTEGENAPLLLPAFERTTGIGVDLQSLPWTAAHEKMLTAYAGDTLPDLMMVSNGWVPEFAAIGAITPVPPTLLGDQFPGIAEQVRVGPHHYGLPWVIGAHVQFYLTAPVRAAGYDRPPADWAGWTAMARRLKARDPDNWPILMMLNWPEHLLSFAVQLGQPLLRDGGRFGNFRSDAFRTALGFYKSLFDDGLAPRLLSTEIEDPLTAFARGTFTLYPGQPYMVGDLDRRPKEIRRTQWATAPMPGPSGFAAGLVGGSSLAVTRNARDPARAWALARYLCTPATQARFHAYTGDLPSRPEAWGPLSDPVSQTFARQIARPGAEPVVAEWERIKTEMQLVAEHMVRGSLSVDAAAAEMDRRADRLLAKRRWMLDRGTLAEATATDSRSAILASPQRKLGSLAANDRSVRWGDERMA